jgi:hypothetical protein
MAFDTTFVHRTQKTLKNASNDKNTGISKYSHSPATILRMSAIYQITNQLQSFFFLETHARDIRADYKTRKEKHRASILSRPVPVVSLEIFVKGIAIASRREGIFSLGQVR